MDNHWCLLHDIFLQRQSLFLSEYFSCLKLLNKQRLSILEKGNISLYLNYSVCAIITLGSQPNIRHRNYDVNLYFQTGIGCLQSTSRVCYKHMPNSYIVFQIFPNFHILKYQTTSNHLPIFSKNILDFSAPSTSSPSRKKKIFHMPWVQHKRGSKLAWSSPSSLQTTVLLAGVYPLLTEEEKKWW